MATYNAYYSVSDFKIGSVVTLASTVIELGDALAVEYPSGSRVPGSVISASPNQIKLEINLEAWRLRPHAPSDGTVHNNLAGSDASFWTVQAKI